MPLAGATVVPGTQVPSPRCRLRGVSKIEPGLCILPTSWTLRKQYFINADGADCILAPVDDAEISAAPCTRCCNRNCVKVRSGGSGNPLFLMYED